ncbi:D-glycero-beta-D-manno-heptose 1,7-bisphosphate 7-phosphatase [Helicobacter sp. MIT 14-3879]|uniref:D-glycero-alpha-D-manno-heptose-1,7-bisphosphate 7-phosphatase n=1 Tax=Helicobacter sp. MIT 14-3879 TaxID=2040649 RepID=UPI000E1EF572|nr:HAD family hydrolase [Helicobacter sp. MIT 14-3879]RDU63959.1 D,D-heptose 1,7-bisphosphate phosphatase [Helicobacter sp. MIT 14-3879]
MQNIFLSKPAVFFDRDGVVNIDTEYIYKIEDFIYMEGFLELFKECKLKGYLLFIITNQSGIGRGYYSLDSFLLLSEFIQNDLKGKFGFCFDKIYFCAHKPTQHCKCRKPNIGMIENANRDFKIDLLNSYIIGDKESDIEAGINAGIGTQILFSKSNKNSKASYVIDYLYKANSIIKSIK